MKPSILVFDRNDDLRHALAKAAPALSDALVAVTQTARAEAEVRRGWPQVLVAGPATLEQDGPRFLQSLHEEHPNLVILLVVNRRGPDIPARDLVRTGACDLVRYPAAANTLRRALERAVKLAGAGATASAVGGSAGGPSSATLTVTSATGGCGKTFFATNTAYELAAHSGKRVALLDLDLQFGEVSTALRLRPDHTISDLLARRNEVGEDEAAEEIRRFATHHSSGIEVLAAPEDPTEADAITSPDVGWVIQAARRAYSYVIIDTPPALTEEVLAAFDLSDGLVVMATLDLPSVKNLGVFLATLERLKVPAEGISLLLNKAETDVGLSPAEVQNLFDRDFAGVLPYSKEVSRSVNAGRPVLESARNAEVSRALARSIRRILDTEPALATGPSASALSRPARQTARRRWWQSFTHSAPTRGALATGGQS